MKKVGAAVAEYFRGIDKWLLLFWTGASALSCMFLYGLYYGDITSTGEIGGTLLMHIYASILGLAAAAVVSLIDYHTLLKLWKLYLPLCLILVGMTFFSPYAYVRGDNRAWLILPVTQDGLSVQPSELLKVSFITTLSIHISKVREHINRIQNVALLCLHGGAHVILIQQQGDSGTALIYVAIFAAMVFCAGISWRYIAAAAAATAAMVPVLWLYILSEDQKMRFLVLQNPELSERYAHQQLRAINAMGYGGMRGAGIFQPDHYYVPEAYNDFIFSFIGQTAGFVGCLGVVALLAAIAFKILFNSRLATDDQGRFICVGVFAMIVSQTAINIGMCLSLLPVIGVTLPLFSAGGSSVLSMYLGLGLVLSVYAHRDTSLFQSREGRL